MTDAYTEVRAIFLCLTSRNARTNKVTVMKTTLMQIHKKKAIKSTEEFYQLKNVAFNEP